MKNPVDALRQFRESTARIVQLEDHDTRVVHSRKCIEPQRHGLRRNPRRRDAGKCGAQGLHGIEGQLSGKLHSHVHVFLGDPRGPRGLGRPPQAIRDVHRALQAARVQIDGNKGTDRRGG
jgi:hypothetical protein